MKLKNIRKILIIKPSSLGDIVHSFPVANALKKIYPDSILCWLVFSHFKEIIELNSAVDEIIEWEKNGKIKEYIRIIKKIRSKNFDLVIDLQGLLRTGLICALSRTNLKIGVPGMRELSWLFSKEIPGYSSQIHAVERNMKIIEFLGGNSNEIIFNINLPEKELNKAKSIIENLSLKPDEKIAGISPVTRVKQKMWPGQNYAQLCDILIEKHKFKIIFFGSENEKQEIQKIINMIKNRTNVFDLSGNTSLKELCCLIKYCNLFIANDTGPLHIAGALNVRSIGFYGPSNPSQLAPYNKDSIFFFKKLNCSPCGIKPSCKNNICMKEITVDEVYEKIKDFSN